jgi:hypothetical protein
MNKNKLTLALLASYLMLCTTTSWAEPKNVNLNYHSNGEAHSVNVNRNYHSNGEQHSVNVNRNFHVSENNGGERFNNSRLGNSDHFNNDTVNINRGGYGAGYQNAPYRGWNEGPVGMSSGWNSGWNNGNENGGWGMGLMEGIVGGIAATSLFNYFFNHNSTPTVEYVNGGGSSGGGNSSTSSNLDTPAPDDITNNTTTNTVINDDSSNLGYWLLGFGVLALGAVGLIYGLRRSRRVNSAYDDERYYEDEERQRHPRSNSRYYRDENAAEDDYAQIDHQRQPAHNNGVRNSRVPHRERRREGY